MTQAQPFVPDDDERWLPVVPFLPFACPQCRSTKPKTYTVRGGGDTPKTRHHKCQSCGVRYKSIELRRNELRRWVDRNEP